MTPIQYKFQSDENLVKLALTNDPKAYYHLVKRYQNKLLRYTTALLHNHDQAEDATQNAFIKAYQNLHRFNPKLKFSSWIYRIAHNEAINSIKKNKRHQTINEPAFLNLQPDKTTSKLTELINQEQAHQLLQTITKLPLKYQEVITLYYFENKSYQEISDILRLPKNTIGTHLSRAKKQLKTLIQKEEHHAKN